MTQAGLVRFLVLSIAVLTLPAAALADESMRCGSRLVSKGATTYEVTKTCGEPQSRQQRSEWRHVRRLAQVPCSPGASTTCIQAVDDLIETQVDEWIYDQGPRRFIRIVTFEQGRLLRVETGGRGSRD